MYVGTSKAILLAKIIWSIAFLGIAFTLVFWGRLKPLHVILYIAMGWFVIFFMDDLLVNFPPGLVKYLIVGGLSYTIGVIFYGFKKIPHGHLIWHLFNIAGSACFYIGFLVTIM
jgi:hemolysin III